MMYPPVVVEREAENRSGARWFLFGLISKFPNLLKYVGTFFLTNDWFDILYYTSYLNKINTINSSSSCLT